ALALIPGVIIQDTTVGTTSIMIRGLSEQFNQKVLFLVEGIPNWISSHGDIPLLGIPIDAIESIEVIRGPGSVLYGTNATAGVINVVLKKDKNQLMASFKTDSLGTLNPSTYWSNKDDNGYTFTSASFQKQMLGYSGYFPTTVVNPPFRGTKQSDGTDWPTSGNLTKKEEFSNFVMGRKIGNWNFLAQYYVQAQNGLGGAPVIFQPNTLTYQGLLLHTDYSKDFGEMTLNTYMDHSIGFMDFSYSNFVPTTSGGVTTGASGYQRYLDPWLNNFRNRHGVNATYKVGNGFLLFGIENEWRHSGLFVKADTSSNVLGITSPILGVVETSLVAQADWNFGNLRAIGGGRFLNNTQAGFHFSPKASLIYSLDHDSSIKLLFSEGFNSPVLSQTNLMVPFVIHGNTNLNAEIVRVLDIAYTFATNETIFVAGGYSTWVSNLIDRSPYAGGGLQYVNSEGFSRKGLEVDFQKILGDFKLIMGGTYNAEGGVLQSGDPFSRYVPRFTLVSGLRYRLSTTQTLSFLEKAWSDRSSVPTQGTLGITYSYTYKNFGLTAGIDNLFDQILTVPDINNGGVIPAIPNGPGRNVSLQVSYTF
ncbi:MAG: TonB-dependent receptor, partial [Bdellovibrionia bacterium]